MATLSGCTIVRNSVSLNYPLEASILTYYSICDEVVIAYDPSTPDGTSDLIDSLCKKYPKIIAVASEWDKSNHEDGTEITIQSNVAIRACTCDWVLYVQADEAIHEEDHNLIKNILEDPSVSASLFNRRSFLFTLDSEIPEYYARSLLRLFRNGEAYAVGDAMTCGLVETCNGKIVDPNLRMYNYSRMGDRDEILKRSRSRDAFHHANEVDIEAIAQQEFTQNVQHCDPNLHPAAIKDFYKEFFASLERSDSSSASLAVLMGPNEHDQIIPFLSNFQNWMGEVIVIDNGNDGGAQLFATHAKHILSRYEVRIVPFKGCGKFADARNLAQELARSAWVLHADLDESWDSKLIQNIPTLLQQLERDGKRLCGFPRANYLRGVLVNDLPSSEWSEVKLAGSTESPWPPSNPDTQMRLMSRSVRWGGDLHESPIVDPSEAVTLRDVWIIHAKSLTRQRSQDNFYRSLGQKSTMPQLTPNLRECVIWEVFHRLPRRAISVFETGTARNLLPNARVSDGWSTWMFAYLLANRSGSQLISVDIDEKCVESSKKIVPPNLHKHVQWIVADSRGILQEQPDKTIDLLYLDSADDPQLILEEFKIGVQKLTPDGIVLIDDTGAYFAGAEGKATLVIPYAASLGYHIEHRLVGAGRMTIIKPKR